METEIRKLQSQVKGKGDLTLTSYGSV